MSLNTSFSLFLFNGCCDCVGFLCASVKIWLSIIYRKHPSQIMWSGPYMLINICLKNYWGQLKPLEKKWYIFSENWDESDKVNATKNSSKQNNKAPVVYIVTRQQKLNTFFFKPHKKKNSLWFIFNISERCRYILFSYMEIGMISKRIKKHWSENIAFCAMNKKENTISWNKKKADKTYIRMINGPYIFGSFQY